MTLHSYAAINTCTFQWTMSRMKISLNGFRRAMHSSNRAWTIDLTSAPVLEMGSMGLMKRVVEFTFTGKYFLLSLCFTAACAPRKAYRIPRPWLWIRKPLCKSKAHQPRSWHGQVCNALVEYIPRVTADGPVYAEIRQVSENRRTTGKGPYSRYGCLGSRSVYCTQPSGNETRCLPDQMTERRQG